MFWYRVCGSLAFEMLENFPIEWKYFEIVKNHEDSLRVFLYYFREHPNVYFYVSVYQEDSVGLNENVGVMRGWCLTLRKIIVCEMVWL